MRSIGERADNFDMLARKLTRGGGKRRGYKRSHRRHKSIRQTKFVIKLMNGDACSKERSQKRERHADVRSRRENPTWAKLSEEPCGSEKRPDEKYRRKEPSPCEIPISFGNENGVKRQTCLLDEFALGASRRSHKKKCLLGIQLSPSLVNAQKRRHRSQCPASGEHDAFTSCLLPSLRHIRHLLSSLHIDLQQIRHPY